MTQTPVPLGPATAAERLEFFRTHGIRGVLVPSRGKPGRLEVREYLWPTVFVGGEVKPFAHRICALRQDHVV